MKKGGVRHGGSDDRDPDASLYHMQIVLHIVLPDAGETPYGAGGPCISSD